eukprot:gene3257-2401_t
MDSAQPSIPLFTIVPEAKEGAPLAAVVAAEERYGVVKRRNDFCADIDQTLRDLQVAFSALLKAQPAMPAPPTVQGGEVVVAPHRRGVVPPHARIAVDAHCQSLTLLQQIHELKVQALSLRRASASSASSAAAGSAP